jgi:hypothetical protein
MERIKVTELDHIVLNVGDIGRHKILYRSKVCSPNALMSSKQEGGFSV